MFTYFLYTAQLLVFSIVTGSVIGLFRYDDGCLTLAQRVFIASVNTFLIFGSAALFSRKYREGNNESRTRFALSLLLAALFTAACVTTISVTLTTFAIAPDTLQFSDYVYIFFIPALLVFATSAYFIRLYDSTRKLQAAVRKFQARPNSLLRNPDTDAPGRSKLEIRERSASIAIPFADILYVASRGKKSTIHTLTRDYETSRLLKSLLEHAPPNIVRVHKSFAANLDFIENVEHAFGGTYVLRLRDEDDSVIPVGRSYLNELRAVLRNAR